MNNASATTPVTLCDASCELHITFPDGGSIEAIEGLNLIFGAGGELNLGDAGTINTNPQPAEMDFSAGGNLSLAVGESITFGVNGSLILGDGGNINYSNMQLNSTGDMGIKAVGGAETINIADLTLDGGLRSIFTAANIAIVGYFSIYSSSVDFVAASLGTVNISIKGVIHAITDAGIIDTAQACNAQDLATSTITLTNTIPIVLHEICTLNLGGILTGDSSELSIGDQSITLFSTGTFSPSPSPSPSLSPSITSVGSLEVNVLTPTFLKTLPDGIEFSTKDGSTCTLSAGECLGVTGARYAVIDGELVLPAEDGGSGSGMLNLFVFALLVMLLLRLRQAQPFRYYGWLKP